MQTNRFLCALALTVLIFTASKAIRADAPPLPKPDLVITNVVESMARGGVPAATITYKNMGTALSKPCVLALVRWTGSGWEEIARVEIPALPVGCDRAYIATIWHKKVKLKPSVYVIDRTNVVDESNKKNNTASPEKELD